ncbi:Ig-like domain-containing protein [Bacillus rubiinfantis]|uniref:Ig-like domain-containing protein n=1 Tax=Bacillus rubiinfantis TaxID=1499680 RepID=UPI000B2DA724|nr:Ig-like domain-containing protein [Bacillus rubiinfantis]
MEDKEGAIKVLKRILIGMLIFCMGFGLLPQTQMPTAKAASAKQQLIIINKKINKLAFYENGKLIKTYPVATGKTRSLTPEGTFYIRAKVKNRPWYKEGIPGGSPRNPLGKRWMELSIKENGGYPYGIHGNNNESSIGKWVSGGCVRMHNWDIEKLFNKVKVGAKVKITRSSKTFNQLAKPFFKNIDTKAPAVPKVNQVSDKSTTVSGKTEAKATVTVTIGSKKYNTTASSKGYFSKKIAKQKAGKKITVTAKDKAGNISKARTVTVVDKTAPVLTVKPVADNQKVVSIKTEKGAYVTVKNGNWTSKVKKATTTGYFTVTIPKPKAYTKVIVTSKDKAKNAVTKSKTVADKTAPTLSVNTVSDASKTITGKTEPGATITVSSEKGRSVKANPNGQFIFKLSKTLKAGSKITMTAKDRAGHVTSKAVTVIDKTAPAVTVEPVTDQSTEVIIKTEAGVKSVNVKIASTNYQAQSVDSKGTYKLTITPQTADSKISVSVTDKAGNIKTVTVTVAKTTTPTVEQN